MQRSYLALAVIVSALLAGCTSREEIALEAAIPPYPDPYRASLQKELRLLADREAARNDHLDAKRFLKRAEEAARAVRVRPHAVEAYDIPPGESRDAIAAARERLMLLYDGGRARAPDALGKAHAYFECWMEEAEEGHQPEDIAWCRDRYDEWEKKVRYNAGLDADWGVVLQGKDGHVGAVDFNSKTGGSSLLDDADAAGFVNEGADVTDAALTQRENNKLQARVMSLMPEPAAEFVVYFALGSSVLEAEALETLEQVAADAQDRPAPDIELLGFADRAGDDQTNLALSGARIEAVRQALLALGAPEDAFLVYARGEAAPAVNTADGVAERRNRRVEITVR